MWWATGENWVCFYFTNRETLFLCSLKSPINKSSWGAKADNLVRCRLKQIVAGKLILAHIFKSDFFSRWARLNDQYNDRCTNNYHALFHMPNRPSAKVCGRQSKNGHGREESWNHQNSLGRIAWDFSNHPARFVHIFVWFIIVSPVVLVPPSNSLFFQNRLKQVWAYTIIITFGWSLPHLYNCSLCAFPWIERSLKAQQKLLLAMSVFSFCGINVG